MTRATDLSEAILARLAAISVANGFHTDIQSVYGFGERKPDRALPPYLLVRIDADEAIKRSCNTAQRMATYSIEGVLSRAAGLQDLQRLHHDILRSLGMGQMPIVSRQRAEWLAEESVEFDPDQNGSTARTLICTLQIHYLEEY
ncbi:hypothetical protein HA520_14985 [Azotobacter chroococcum]|uniref:Uncharacterized protein n=1 Tax=Azotobacter chroococcum TaxID=353 RepID=A0AA43Z8Y4_9GAMM|nr:hypothetical protein [Azotobacter chroococcum]NHN78567.1 hypothetical protein [Azotobacter chroococcum]